MQHPTHPAAQGFINHLMLLDSRLPPESRAHDVSGVVIAVASEVGDVDLGIRKLGLDQPFDFVGVHGHAKVRAIGDAPLRLQIVDKLEAPLSPIGSLAILFDFQALARLREQAIGEMTFNGVKGRSSPRSSNKTITGSQNGKGTSKTRIQSERQRFVESIHVTGHPGLVGFSQLG
jgi:hypothetical protein